MKNGPFQKNFGEYQETDSGSTRCMTAMLDRSGVGPC